METLRQSWSHLLIWLTAGGMNTSTDLTMRRTWIKTFALPCVPLIIPMLPATTATLQCWTWTRATWERWTWRQVFLPILLRGLTFFLRQVILISWQKWSLRTYLNAILLYVLGVVSDDNFSTVKFPSSTSTHDIKDKYIYAAFNSITYDKESCASLCYTHTISSTACQFFILYSDTCMLGNFQSTETYTSPQDSFTAYFNESE